MKIFYTFLCLSIWQLSIQSQNLDVHGKARITEMDPHNTLDSVVVWKSDGTLAVSGSIMDYIKALELRIDALENCGSSTITDFDGNSYSVISIGNQCWTATNMRATHYSNGTAIPRMEDNCAWGSNTSARYGWYNDDSATYALPYGALYNYYAIASTNPLNVCPAGWQIASDSAWALLNANLTTLGYGNEGSGNDIAKAIASKSLWMNSANVGAIGYQQASNNATGFNGFPTGFGSLGTQCLNMGEKSYWWCSAPFDGNFGRMRFIGYNSDAMFSSISDPRVGLPVRCVKMH